MGGTLARRLAALGHHVSVANSRGPETLAEFATETGAVPVPITEIGRDADVMIIAIPEKSIPNLPDGLLGSCRCRSGPLHRAENRGGHRAGSECSFRGSR